MKTIRVLAGCAFALCLALPAFAQTDFRVRVNLGNAPPPPVVYVNHAPRTVWLPAARVAVVNDPDFDDDYFQVGSYWYVYRAGYWYRARTWRGPFTVIDDRYVPTSITMVPARHWRHSRWTGPRYASTGPGYDRYQRGERWRDRYGRWHYREYDRNRNNGWWDRDGNWHSSGGWRDRDGNWHDDRDDR